MADHLPDDALRISMDKSYKVFHTTCEKRRKQIHIILVRPEEGGNVGAVARALENMGVRGNLFIVGNPGIVNGETQKFAKHAFTRVEEAIHFPTLEDALKAVPSPVLSLASTARIGSPRRPHPLQVRDAVQKATRKLLQQDINNLAFVFGPESSGLTNEEVELCDWVISIPATKEYRSLNLAQAVLIFCYEANMTLMQEWVPSAFNRPGQRDRLIRHLLQVAEASGFIFPGDPQKMRPRLEEILSRLPKHIYGIATIHGLLNQVYRSLLKGFPDIRGRYRNRLEISGR